MKAVLMAENHFVDRNIKPESIVHIMDKASETHKGVTSTPDRNTGLLFGFVQSGKTNGMIGSIAYGFDQGLQNVIVLTPSDDDLYRQTEERLEMASLPFSLITKNEIQRQRNLAEIQKEFPVMLVTSKHHTRLEQLIDLLETSDPDKRWVIYDDEADHMSPNAASNKEERSTTNRLINSIFEIVNVESYIQVTATPQALILQNIGNEFRPSFTTILEPGEGYIGGEELFLSNHAYARYLRPYTFKDIVLNFDTEDFIVPLGLRDAIYSFVTAATIKVLQKSGKRYSFLCHASSLNDHQESTRDLINLETKKIIRYLKSIDIDDIDYSNIAVVHLKEAYDDLSRTVEDVPPFEEVVDLVKHMFISNKIQVINSSEIGQSPKFTSYYNFLIGGNKLSRGLTIPNLVTTYYTRDPYISNMDTMGQHARMYGYREDDLDIMRIFSTQRIFDKFANLTETEIGLREYLKNHSSDGIVPIEIGEGLRACRSNVIDFDSIIYTLPGQGVFPRRPIQKGQETATKELDDVLLKYLGKGTDSGHDISIDFLIEVIEKTSATKEDNETWNRDFIIAYLRAVIERYSNIGHLIVRKDRDLGGPRIAAYWASGDKELADKTKPTLYMYRLTGKVEKGWSEDCPFWVPNLHYPDSKNVFLATLPE